MIALLVFFLVMIFFISFFSRMYLRKFMIKRINKNINFDRIDMFLPFFKDMVIYFEFVFENKDKVSEKRLFIITSC